MDLNRYVEELRHQLLVAAEAGGEEGRQLADRLVAPLQSATRLVLLDALSAAASEITSELAPDILRVQDELMIAGAELATAPEAADRLADGVSRVTPEMAAELEPLIDKYMDRVDLPPKFVLPGGTTLSAALDLARTVVRRAERRVVTLLEAGELGSPDLLRFLNRASDLAFAMARYADVDEPELFAGRERA